MCNVYEIYLVFAAPQIGFCRLLQVPSSDRYGDLIQRGGAFIHLIAFETAAFPYKKLFSNVEAPGMMLLRQRKTKANKQKTLNGNRLLLSSIIYNIVTRSLIN